MLRLFFAGLFFISGLCQAAETVLDIINSVHDKN